MKRIIIIGAGGNSKVLIDTVLERVKNDEDIKIIGILDDDPLKKEFQGFPVIGPVARISEYARDKDIWFINGIGSNEIRKSICLKYGETIQYDNAVHPTAIIGSDVTIGSGSVVMAGAIINTGTKIGKQVIVNTGAILEHDNIIDDFAHIASGTVTAGNVRVGECSMLGTGTRVIQGIKIGSNVMIGAGATVIDDINDNCTAVGVPAKIIKQR
jgi:sugar O-acyltransferase (sialic acid O-acetyltransferase NeuD family)